MVGLARFFVGGVLVRMGVFVVIKRVEVMGDRSFRKRMIRREGEESLDELCRKLVRVLFLLFYSNNNY